MQPKHPVYIVSKSRHEKRLTSRCLDYMGVPHYMVVEQQQLEDYARGNYGHCTLLVLPPAYQLAYETCDDLGGSKSYGPGPARNFAWDHSLEQGASWHWVMDDNITTFFRLHENRYYQAVDGTTLRAMEDFAERYRNVGMAGPNYYMFTPRRQRHAPVRLNTRIYSCNLIRNDVPYRWRGRYNEDTDLSLRMLKDGWVTFLYLAYPAKKLWTQTVPGGNTAEFYEREGTLPKSEMLVRLHPDVAQLKWRYGRVHHLVDYSGFKQQPRLRAGLELPAEGAGYGFVEVPRDGTRTPIG